MFLRRLLTIAAAAAAAAIGAVTVFLERPINLATLATTIGPILDTVRREPGLVLAAVRETGFILARAIRDYTLVLSIAIQESGSREFGKFLSTVIRESVSTLSTTIWDRCTLPGATNNFDVVASSVMETTSRGFDTVLSAAIREFGPVLDTVREFGAALPSTMDKFDAVASSVMEKFGSILASAIAVFDLSAVIAVLGVVIPTAMGVLSLVATIRPIGFIIVYTPFFFLILLPSQITAIAMEMLYKYVFVPAKHVIWGGLRLIDFLGRRFFNVISFFATAFILVPIKYVVSGAKIFITSLVRSVSTRFLVWTNNVVFGVIVAFGRMIGRMAGLFLSAVVWLVRFVAAQLIYGVVLAPAMYVFDFVGRFICSLCRWIYRYFFPERRPVPPPRQPVPPLRQPTGMHHIQYRHASRNRRWLTSMFLEARMEALKAFITRFKAELMATHPFGGRVPRPTDYEDFDRVHETMVKQQKRLRNGLDVIWRVGSDFLITNFNQVDVALNHYLEELVLNFDDRIEMWRQLSIGRKSILAPRVLEHVTREYNSHLAAMNVLLTVASKRLLGFYVPTTARSDTTALNSFKVTPVHFKPIYFDAMDYGARKMVYNNMQQEDGVDHLFDLAEDPDHRLPDAFLHLVMDGNWVCEIKSKYYMFNLMGLLGQKGYFQEETPLDFDLIQLLIWKYRALCLGKEESIEVVRRLFGNAEQVLDTLHEVFRCIISVNKPV